MGNDRLIRGYVPVKVLEAAERYVKKEMEEVGEEKDDDDAVHEM